MQTKLDGGIKIFQSHTQIERKTAEWFDCLTKKTGETNRKKDAERKKNNQFSCHYSVWYNYFRCAYAWYFHQLAVSSYYIVNGWTNKKVKMKNCYRCLDYMHWMVWICVRANERRRHERLELRALCWIEFRRLAKSKESLWKMKCRAVYCNSRFRRD